MSKMLPPTFGTEIYQKRRRHSQWHIQYTPAIPTAYSAKRVLGTVLLAGDYRRK
jgi:hypothetical protein